jgi:fluoride exporter
MNGLIAKFPFGTFAANMFGTMALGLAYDLQRAQ